MTFYCRECNISYMGQTHECETIRRYRAEMSICEWTCERCGETFDSKQTSALQHVCPIAKESAQFDSLFTKFLDSIQGKFAVYYAQRIINASIGSNNTLVES